MLEVTEGEWFVGNRVGRVIHEYRNRGVSHGINTGGVSAELCRVNHGINTGGVSAELCRGLGDNRAADGARNDVQPHQHQEDQNHQEAQRVRPRPVGPPTPPAGGERL